MAVYSDNHTVFRVNGPDTKGDSDLLLLGRALVELGVEILFANYRKARGRVIRVNFTLQDRLVNELTLAEISDMSTGTSFLPRSGCDCLTLKQPLDHFIRLAALDEAMMN